MKSKNAFRLVLLILGCALLLASIVFLIAYTSEYRSISVNIGQTVGFLENVMPDITVGIKEERSNNEMPSVTYGGQDFVGILSLPEHSVKLPIRSSWDRNAVKKVPCIYTGSVYNGTLIIGGVDAEGQFDFISQIDVGDTVTVTDMKGVRFSYTVSTVRHAKNSKTSTLTDGKYDLTLFVKDRRTGDWLLVRCEMKRSM